MDAGASRGAEGDRTGACEQGEPFLYISPAAESKHQRVEHRKHNSGDKKFRIELFPDLRSARCPGQQNLHCDDNRARNQRGRRA